MSMEGFDRIEEVFNEAVELEGEARRAFLDRACAGDAELRRDVERLLAHDDDAGLRPGKSKLDRMQEQIAGAIGIGHEESGTAKPPSHPERIGHYNIIEKIGEGGMGSVYLAEQDDPRRRVALKVIRPDVFSPSLLKRFQFEAEVLGRLQHPGIAQIHEAGKIETESGGRPYFAMEYVEGAGLRSYAERHDLGVRARLELTARICDAAHHAHLKGIVHRDLKPDNVLVVDASSTTTADGGREFAQLGQPKVLDFGVARATDSDVQMTTMHTDVGRLVGTITYMSPEQLSGDSRHLDARSDIYALGTMLYELLAGRPPFDLRNKSIPEAARIIREEDPTRLGSMRTVFRGDIDTIVCKALEKDRDRRYQSAAELAADLRRYLANEPIIAHSPSTFYRLKKFARRNKGLVAGLILAFLILVVGIISSLTFAVRAVRGERQALKSEAEARRTAYRLSLTAADAVGEADPVQALIHLAEIPPEFRGWEWRHLRARLTPHMAEYNGDHQGLASHGRARFHQRLSVTACRADDTLIAALVRESGIELKDMESGEILGAFGNENGPGMPILSPGGSHLALISGTGEKLSVWTVQSEKKLFEMSLTSAGINDARFSPDGSCLVVASNEGARVIDSTTGRCRFRTAPHPADASLIAFSPDGARFALAGRRWGDRRLPEHNFFVSVHSLSGECFVHREILSEGVQAMAFSADGTRLAVGQLQRMIRILDAATLEEISVLLGHNRGITALAYPGDGARLASASTDGTIRLWDPNTGATSRVFMGLPTKFGATALTFSRDGERLAAGNYLGARLWELQQVDCRVLEGHESYVYLVSFNPDGSLIASTSWDDTVRLWDPLTGELLATLPEKGSRWKLSFAPDGNRLIGDRIWDTGTGDQLSTPRAETDPPLFEELARQIRVDKRYNSLIRVFAGGAKLAAGAGERVALSRDRSLVVDGTASGEICIDDRATGKTLKRLGKHDVRVLATAFSPDATKVVSGDEKGVVKVWDLDSGVELATLRGHTLRVYSVNYSPDGKRIVTGGNDRTLILWDAETFEKILVLRGHTGYVHSVCFSPDGTMLASASGDGTIRVWDSVLPAERRRQIQRERALRHEAEPLVDRLLADLGDPLDAADHLRGDGALKVDLRRAALSVLLRRSAAMREGKPRR